MKWEVCKAAARLLLICTGLVLFCRHLIIIVKPHTRESDRLLPYHGWDPALNLTLNPHKRFIILLTSYRGGSSFLGKIFDQNPACYYMFEPLHDGLLRKWYALPGKIMGAAPYHVEADLKLLYLQQIMHNCTSYPTVFYEKHEFCGGEEENWARFNNSECGKEKQIPANQGSCNYRDTTVLKVIRLQHLRNILKIKNIRSANVQIVHNIRIPAAMIASRRGGGWYLGWYRFKQLESEGTRQEGLTKLSFEALTHCQETLETLRILESEPWLKSRYMRVSHRQLSLQPIDTAQKIYSFLNMTFSEDLKNFLLDITTNKEIVEESKLDLGPLGTSKNSSEIVEKFKRMERLSISAIKAIESQCTKLMKISNNDFLFDSISYPEYYNIHR